MVIFWMPTSMHEQQGAYMLQDSPMYAYLPAFDVARARGFYEQTLGFKPGLEVEGGVSYDCGNGTSCFLYPTPNAGSSQASQAFWQVADIEAEVAELKTKGVKFERYGMPGEDESGIVTTVSSKAAWFQDTEGNILAIIQGTAPK
jgi:predicted enzyme related to lactoylglutathione lyase